MRGEAEMRRQLTTSPAAAVGPHPGCGSAHSVAIRLLRHHEGSEGGGTRTHDLGIKSPLLYQLSYAPVSTTKVQVPKYLKTLNRRQPQTRQDSHCAQDCAQTSYVLTSVRLLACSPASLLLR